MKRLPNARKNERKERRNTEEAGQQSKEQERRKTYVAKEKSMADAHEARKSKVTKSQE